MIELTLKARAKINLTLDAVKKREDGYHQVEMIMQEIDLWDRVCLIFGSEGRNIWLECDHPGVPTGRDNIAYRAAELVRDTFGVGRGVKIKIIKNIPAAAGLGGGSADAAAVIKGLNDIWGLNMDIEQMAALGVKLGADVPFCIMGGTALATGIGEILQPVKPAARLDLLLVKPDIMISTAWVYANLDLQRTKSRPDNKGMVRAIEAGDKEGIAKGMVNVLEDVVLPRYPEVGQIKKAMADTGALGAVMSGSGPTVAGIYNDRRQAMEASQYFSRIYRDVVLTSTI